MSTNKTDRSFKTLLNKRVTSESKAFYEEIGDFTVNVHGDEIWGESIDPDPAQAVLDGVAEERTLFVLTEDTSVAGQQAWYADDAGRLKDWISDKFGSNYGISLYDNGNNEIFPTDPSGWLFDHQTGILTFDGSTSSFAKPFKISGHRYIGLKGAGGTPGGLDTQIQYNNTGVFDGIPGATYDGTSFTIDTVTTSFRPVGAGTNSVAIGNGAIASTDESISIGLNAQQSHVSAIGAVCIGRLANSKADRGVAIGYNAFNNTGLGAIAVGYNSSSVNGGISIGYSSSSNNNSSIAIGYDATISGNGVAIGYQVDAVSGNNVAIGYQAISVNQSVVIGTNAESTNTFTVAIGGSAYAGAGQSTAVGQNTACYHTGNTAVGYNTKIGSATDIYTIFGATAIGYNSRIEDRSDNGVAIGYNIVIPSGLLQTIYEITAIAGGGYVDGVDYFRMYDYNQAAYVYFYFSTTPIVEDTVTRWVSYTLVDTAPTVATSIRNAINAANVAFGHDWTATGPVGAVVTTTTVDDGNRSIIESVADAGFSAVRIQSGDNTPNDYSNTIAIGSNFEAKANDLIAIGHSSNLVYNAITDPRYSVFIGNRIIAETEEVVAIGHDQILGEYSAWSVFIGNYIEAPIYTYDAVIIGYDAYTVDECDYSTVVGDSAGIWSPFSSGSIAIGARSYVGDGAASASYASAYGYNAISKHSYSYAFGYYGETFATRQFSIGSSTAIRDAWLDIRGYSGLSLETSGRAGADQTFTIETGQGPTYTVTDLVSSGGSGWPAGTYYCTQQPLYNGQPLPVREVDTLNFALTTYRPRFATGTPVLGTPDGIRLWIQGPAGSGVEGPNWWYTDRPWSTNIYVTTPTTYTWIEDTNVQDPLVDLIDPSVHVQFSRTKTNFVYGDFVVGGTVADEKLTVDGVISLQEQSSAPGLTAGYGKIFAGNDDTPYYLNASGDSLEMIVPFGTGTDSVKLRGATDAAGNESYALGIDSLAEDFQSVAFMGANAVGNRSFAFGDDASTYGTDAIAFGYQATAMSAWAVSVGREAHSGSGEGVAVGYETIAGGYRSTAMGYQAKAYGDRGVAIGDNALIHYNATYAVAIGLNSEVRGTAAVAGTATITVTGMSGSGFTGGTPKDSFTLSDGVGPAVTFWFYELNPPVNRATDRYIDFSVIHNDTAIASLIATAINNTPNLLLTASTGGTSVVTITHDRVGVGGGSLVENVINPLFLVTGFSGATTGQQGTYSVAIGYQAKALSDYTVVVGPLAGVYDASISGNRAFGATAIGAEAYVGANGDYSIVMGRAAKVNALDSLTGTHGENVVVGYASGLQRGEQNVVIGPRINHTYDANDSSWNVFIGSQWTMNNTDKYDENVIIGEWQTISTSGLDYTTIVGGYHTIGGNNNFLTALLLVIVILIVL